jgi:hypothetical protein
MKNIALVVASYGPWDIGVFRKPHEFGVYRWSVMDWGRPSGSITGELTFPTMREAVDEAINWCEQQAHESDEVVYLRRYVAEREQEKLAWRARRAASEGA